jgi:hypothetical protein
MRWSCYRARRPASRQRGCIRSRLHKLNKLLNQQKGVRRIAPAQRLATQGKGSDIECRHVSEGLDVVLVTLVGVDHIVG